MNNFRIKQYDLSLDSLPSGREVRLVYVTDLHGGVYGEGQKDLISVIRNERPDAVLAGGDMMIRHDPDSLDAASDLLTGAAEFCPVYYAMGNHETRQKLTGKFRTAYRKYEKRLRQAGVRFLANSSEILTLQDVSLRIYGLELPLSPWYKKPFSPALQKEALDYYLRPCDKEMPTILLAHNPYYAETYFDWGADLILCGHYHGGVVRFDEHRGLVSPQFRLFPRYCCGDYYRQSQCMLVSAGLGDHALHLRIHNPREVLSIRLRKREDKWPST